MWRSFDDGAKNNGFSTTNYLDIQHLGNEDPMSFGSGRSLVLA
jgi:hypothetical protein